MLREIMTKLGIDLGVDARVASSSERNLQQLVETFVICRHVEFDGSCGVVGRHVSDAAKIRPGIEALLLLQRAGFAPALLAREPIARGYVSSWLLSSCRMVPPVSRAAAYVDGYATY